MTYKVYTADGNAKLVQATSVQDARADVIRRAIRLVKSDYVAYYHSTIINGVELFSD